MPVELEPERCSNSAAAAEGAAGIEEQDLAICHTPDPLA
jgi:hypothetical protein